MNFDEFLQERPATAERGRFIGRAFLTAEIVHLPDVLADPEYSFPTGPQVGGYRAFLGSQWCGTDVLKAYSG